MSDVKKPMAGEWWECTDGFRLFVVGRKLSGSLLSQTERGNIETYTIGGDEWKHLPDCNGWNWKPEVFPQYWDVIHEETAAYNRRDSADAAFCVMKDGTERKWTYEFGAEHKKKHTQITKEQAEALLYKLEVFPQYWTTLDRDSKLPTATAFVIRKNKIDWNLVWKNGDHGIAMGAVSKWSPSGRTQITKEQAEALLLPKESPDDWVVQDRVPARARVDRGHFGGSFKSPEDMWGFVSDSIGIGEMHGHQGMVVYCRRKDLPEISPKAETCTVVIIRWLCWNEVGKARLIHAEKPPNGYKHCENRGEEKFEVSL